METVRGGVSPTGVTSATSGSRSSTPIVFVVAMGILLSYSFREFAEGRIQPGHSTSAWHEARSCMTSEPPTRTGKREDHLLRLFSDPVGRFAQAALVKIADEQGRAFLRSALRNREADAGARRALVARAGEDPAAIAGTWAAGEARWRLMRAKYLLY